MKLESLVTLGALAAAAFLVASAGKVRAAAAAAPAGPPTLGTFLGQPLVVGGDPSTVYGWGLGLSSPQLPANLWGQP